MFSSERYVTKGVMTGVPPMLQMYLWGLVDELPEPKDYLQVFVLSEWGGKQRIIHKQECPEYEREYLVSFGEPITAKIYAIDDETHSTMLFSSEY